MAHPQSCASRSEVRSLSLERTEVLSVTVMLTSSAGEAGHFTPGALRIRRPLLDDWGRTCVQFERPTEAARGSALKNRRAAPRERLLRATATRDICCP